MCSSMPSVTDLMGVAAEQSFKILAIATNHYGSIHFGHWCPPLRNHLKSKFTFKIKYHFDTRNEKAAGNTRSSRKKLMVVEEMLLSSLLLANVVLAQ